MPINPGQQSKPPQRSNVRISIPIHPSIDAHVRAALNAIANQLSQVTPPKGTIGLPNGAITQSSTTIPAQGTDLTSIGSQSSGAVLVDSSDSVADYLSNKIPSTASITATILNSGGDEQLILTVPGATTSAPGIVQLEASSTDTSASHVVTANDTRLTNVASLNTLTGAVDLVAGSNVTITPSGNNLTIASTGGGGLTNPMTTEFDLIVGGVSGVPTRIAGTITAPDTFLRSGGNGSYCTGVGWYPLFFGDYQVWGGVPGCPRIVTLASSTGGSIALPEISGYIPDLIIINLLSGAITGIVNSGSWPVYDGGQLMFRISDNGTARAITWGSLFIASGVATLPTTTVVGKIITAKFYYDASKTAFVILASDPAGY